MLKYSAKQCFRENKGFLKNYGLFYVVFVASAVLGLAFLAEMGKDPYVCSADFYCYMCAWNVLCLFGEIL